MSEEESQLARQALINGAGYYLLRELIDPETADEVRRHVLAHLEEGEENAPGDVNLLNLHERGPLFEKLITAPRLLTVARALLGEDVKLAAFSAKVLSPGCGKGRLHVDYPYWAMDPGMPVEPALMMQVIWMMQPFTEENGGTWILPGSQQYGQEVDINRFKQDAVQATGNAGDALISHGMLWHQTARNQSAEPRVAVLINFSQLSIRPMRELGPYDEAWLSRIPEDLRRLLPVDWRSDLVARLRARY